MKCLVTGGAGFIGSTLVDRLLSDGFETIAYDNFSTGFPQFIDPAGKVSSFRFVQGDILDTAKLQQAMEGCEIVYHFAANADIRGGLTNPRKDIDQNTLGTYSVLEAMRAAGVKKIAFASSSAVYGNATVIPTPEDAPMPVQISMYGASKLSGEGLITAYCEAYGFQSWIFRYVSIMGQRYTHGHVYDFVNKLRRDPHRLEILGDGKQRKSYVHVQDCVSGIRLAVDRASESCNIFNISLDEYVPVDQSAKWVTSRMQLAPVLEYTGGERGWIGDAPFVWLDASKLKALGWSPRHSIEQSVYDTTDWLMDNEWALKRN